MSAVVELATGAHVLPNRRDERVTVTEWVAHLACDADLRTKAPEYRALAEHLLVVDWPKCQGDLGKCPNDAEQRGLLRPCRHRVHLCWPCSSSAHARTQQGLVYCEDCERDVDRIEWTPLENVVQL